MEKEDYILDVKSAEKVECDKTVDKSVCLLTLTKCKDKNLGYTVVM